MVKYSRRRRLTIAPSIISNAMSMGSGLYNAYQANPRMFNDAASTVSRIYRGYTSRKRAREAMNMSGMTDARSMPAGYRRGAGQRRRNVTMSSEWNVKGGTISKSIANRLSSHVVRHRFDYPKHVDYYEAATEVEFDSPKQGIHTGLYFGKDHVKTALATALFNQRTNVGMTTGTPQSLATAVYAGVDYPSAWSPGDAVSQFDKLGLGSYRMQDINCIVEGLYEKKSIQNTCSNTLSFTYEVWKSRYPKYFGANTDLDVLDNYQPESLQDTIDSINMSDMNAADAPFAINGNPDRVSPYRYGTSLSSFSGVRQYWVKKGVIKFILKPGEQRDIYIRCKGPHRVDLAKFRMFSEFDATLHFSLTVRANQVGEVGTTAISHGSGQYSIIRKTTIAVRFGAMAVSPTKRILSAELDTILPGAEETINPETDAPQGYQEMA